MWTFDHYKRHYLRIFRWKLAGNAHWVDCKPVYSLEAGQSPDGAKSHHIRTHIGLTYQRRRMLSIHGMHHGQAILEIADAEQRPKRLERFKAALRLP